MKQVVAPVVSNIKILGEFKRPRARAKLSTWIIWLHCPEIAQEAKPGQFVMVRCGEECVLPRPFSIHQVNEKGDMALCFAVLEDGKGTGWLSQCQTSDTVELLGPLGNGFSIYHESHNLLLVAGGWGIAPLYFLAQEALKKEYSVTLLYGTANVQRYPVSPDIKLVTATENGSEGQKGMITDLLPEYADWADQIFACGPMSMYRDMALKKQELNLEGKPVQVSLEVRMGCGRGVCYGCTLKTRQSLKQVCKDGPVFNLDDILWDELKY